MSAFGQVVRNEARLVRRQPTNMIGSIGLPVVLMIIFGELPSFHRILISENKWLGARYGLEAPVMDLATGRRNRVPVAQLIRRTLRDLEPHARELGSERELEGIEEILRRGNSAEAQLRVFNANRDIVEVVRAIADATETLPAGAVSPAG